jgi:hypothetical protein
VRRTGAGIGRRRYVRKLALGGAAAGTEGRGRQRAAWYRRPRRWARTVKKTTGTARSICWEYELD